jgi:predicted RNA-binding protein YlxR (DUF448 family)
VRRSPRDTGALTGTAAAELAAAESGPQRRCLVTGEVRPKDALVRFVVSPDGAVVPDVARRLPGRGLWLTARRDIVAAAAAKRVFARAARRSVTVSADLPDAVERLLARRCSELIGLARRAGEAVAGFEKVREELRAGRAGLLLEASDGADGGRGKLLRLARGSTAVVDLLTAAELGAAFGRDHAVHGALARGRLAERLLAEAERLKGFRAGGAAGQETDSEAAPPPPTAGINGTEAI